MEMMESRRYYRGCLRGVSMDSRAFYIVLFFNVFFFVKKTLTPTFYVPNVPNVPNVPDVFFNLAEFTHFFKQNDQLQTQPKTPTTGKNNCSALKPQRTQRTQRT